jgi:hypothetical protein
MPRIRWAERCGARSSRTGLPCGAWSVRGARVCVTHGGSLSRTKETARLVLVKEVFDRAFDQAYAEWQRRVVAFNVQRVLTTARLLGMPVEDVGREHVIWCHAVHGEPPLDDQAPKIADIPFDGRLRKVVDAA